MILISIIQYITVVFNEALTGWEYSQSRDGIDSCRQLAGRHCLQEKRQIDSGGYRNVRINKRGISND